MAEEPTGSTAALPRPDADRSGSTPGRIDTRGATVAAGALGDETEPGSLHARVLRGLARGAAVGRYLVLAELGRGGMGVVYAGYDPDLDRRIAIKVLRAGSDEGTGGSARLLREAQALAKLAHPNVIAVFDVGTVDDEVFVAMELVQGGTLRDHVAGKSWREVVAAYVDAGRGLAAAHAAGLVHRDFKPENVLVGADRRPRVTDFGLVRATAGAGDRGGSTDPEPGRAPAPTTALDSDLTAEGTVMGTPTYMAPEQMVGEPTSPATDQYAFSVALWEALFAIRPYAGKDVGEVHAAVVAGTRVPFERGEVPLRVVRALERGLAAAPDARWPTIEALLAELETAARPATRRRLAIAIAIMVGLVALAVGGIATYGTRGDDCAHAGDPAATLWSRAPVVAAFHAAAPAFGDDAVPMVEAWVGAWRDDWRRRAHAACVATRVEHTQSDAVLDQRMSCLIRKLDAARAEVDGLTHADRAGVERAGESMMALPELADCDDVEVLRGRAPLPGDPAARQRIGELEHLLDQLSGRRTTTFSDAARTALRGEVATAVERATATGHAPLIAQAHWLEGAIAIDLADGKAARPALLAAAAAAIRGGDPAALADAYLGLAEVATALVVDHSAAHGWVELAAAVIDGLRDPGHRRIVLEQRRASLARDEGDFVTARAALDRALATPALPVELALGLRGARANVDTQAGAYDDAEREISALLPISTERLGAAHPHTADLIHDAGNIAFYRGQYAHAEELHGQALRLREAAFGTHSPELLTSLQAIGVDENMQGHIPDAQAMLQRALEIARATYGNEHVEVASLLSDLGGTYNRAKDHVKELAINREVLAIRQHVLGPDNPETALTMVNLGIAAKNVGTARNDRALIAEAITTEEGARAIFLATYGPDHFNLGAVDDNLGWAYLAAGRADDAVAAFTRSEATFTRATGSADHPALGDPLTGHGVAELARRHPDEAITLLERALVVRDAPDVDPGDLADTRLALARALRAAGRDAPRARQLAEQALAVWKDRGTTDRAAEAAKFLGLSR